MSSFTSEDVPVFDSTRARAAASGSVVSQYLGYIRSDLSLPEGEYPLIDMPRFLLMQEVVRQTGRILEVAAELSTDVLSYIRSLSESNPRNFAQKQGDGLRASMTAGKYEPGTGRIIVSLEPYKYSDGRTDLSNPDGQHTTFGALHAQTDQQIVVSFAITPSSAIGKRLDKGKARTLAQTLAHEGVTDSAVVASVIGHWTPWHEGARDRSLSTELSVKIHGDETWYSPEFAPFRKHLPLAIESAKEIANPPVITDENGNMDVKKTKDQAALSVPVVAFIFSILFEHAEQSLGEDDLATPLQFIAGLRQNGATVPDSDPRRAAMALLRKPEHFGATNNEAVRHMTKCVLLTAYADYVASVPRSVYRISTFRREDVSPRGKKRTTLSNIPELPERPA